jgi:uncharacterized protein YebE (UPF0316 family)
MDPSFFDSVWFSYLILPVLIFATRIVDVSLDTIRVVYIARGNKIIAPILGFFAVLIWLVAITQIMKNLDNVMCYIAYAGGYATGNYVGLIIEEKLALGFQVVRVITSKDSSPLIEDLRNRGFGVTTIWAEGKDGKVHIIFLIVKRSNISEVISIINVFNPKAFYSIEDVRSLNSKHGNYWPKLGKTQKYNWFRKGK